MQFFVRKQAKAILIATTHDDSIRCLTLREMGGKTHTF